MYDLSYKNVLCKINRLYHHRLNHFVKIFFKIEIRYTTRIGVGKINSIQTEDSLDLSLLFH